MILLHRSFSSCDRQSQSATFYASCGWRWLSSPVTIFFILCLSISKSDASLAEAFLAPLPSDPTNTEFSSSIPTLTTTTTTTTTQFATFSPQSRNFPSIHHNHHKNVFHRMKGQQKSTFPHFPPPSFMPFSKENVKTQMSKMGFNDEVIAT